MKSYGRLSLLAVLAVASGACGTEEPSIHTTTPAVPVGEFAIARSETVPARIEASGTAKPFAEATLSTKLMGTVEEVRVREGDRVRRGDVLLELDARDLDAKAAQAEAGLAEASAVLREAEVNAERMRMLFAEEAAPMAQLDAAETGLARARAGVETAKAAAAELSAVRDYATLRAPFDGTVVRRLVDAGSFAAPGAPLLVVQDGRRLRVSVTATPESVTGLDRGDVIAGTIEQWPVEAAIEGVVPASSSLYTVNAIVNNTDGRFLAGSAATLLLPAGERNALLVPSAAIRREGDLTGVYVKVGEDDVALRWVRLGAESDDLVEVLSGIRDGDRVLVPTTVTGAD
jgi:RND family efflux transporter MFP subunit